MNTLADFSHEVENAFMTAALMVKHNRENVTDDIAWSRSISSGPDDRTWDVTWAYKPSTGEIIVCWWSPVR